MATQLKFTNTQKNSLTSIAYSGTPSSVSISGVDNTYDRILHRLSAITDDTTNAVMQIILKKSDVEFVIGTVTIPLSSGYTGSVAIYDVLAQIATRFDGNGNKYFVIEKGCEIYAKQVTMSSAKKVVFCAEIGTLD